MGKIFDLGDSKEPFLDVALQVGLLEDLEYFREHGCKFVFMPTGNKNIVEILHRTENVPVELF